MKFTWERESPTGSCVLTATPGDYDGSPMPAVLSTDIVPRTVSPDRLAAAFVLAFHRYLSGEVLFPYEIHPEMAGAISEFMKPTTIFISGIDFKAAVIPTGTNTFGLNPAGEFKVDHSWKGFEAERIIELNLPSVSNSFSHNFCDDVLTAPTNAAVISSNTNDFLSTFPYMAVAILLCEDFDIGTIRLPFTDPKTIVSRRVAALFQASGLILRYTE